MGADRSRCNRAVAVSRNAYSRERVAVAKIAVEPGSRAV